MRTSKTDSQLISMFKNGNDKAFGVLLNRYKQKVFGYIYFKTKDADVANDIFQETFIKVVDQIKLGKYNEEGKFSPWVMRIAHNMVIDHFRLKKRSPIPSSTLEWRKDDAEGFSIFSDLELKPLIEQDVELDPEITENLNTLISLLPTEQQDVLKLRFHSQMSFKEIAEEKEISINTALGRVRYALINIRKLIQQENLSLSLD